MADTLGTLKDEEQILYPWNALDTKLLCINVRDFLNMSKFCTKYRGSLLGDIIAGITIASIIIPQSISYASSLAKLEPTTGLVRTMSFPARAQNRFVTHGLVVRRRRYSISDTDPLCVVFSCHSRLHICTVGLLPSAERWPRGSFSAHCGSSDIFYYALRPTRPPGESHCRRYCGLHNHYLPGELSFSTLCM